MQPQQPSLLDYAVTRDTAAVIRARDAAMSQVAQHADEQSPRFSDKARAFILRYLAEHGPTSGEDLTDACVRAGICPHDLRAFGPVIHGLSRRNEITAIGSCKRMKGHGTAGGTIWALTREQ